MTGCMDPLLILGGDGLLGSALVRELRRPFRVIATCRSHTSPGDGLDDLTIHPTGGLDTEGLPWLAAIIDRDRPRMIMNAIGQIPRRPDPDGTQSIVVNALFPRRLRAICRTRNIPIIHISTDAVFSGDTGGYREEDPPDPTDLYGRTKLLGELIGPEALTLRTSFIGFDRRRRHHQGLLTWFLAQTGRVPGHRLARWSGLTCQEVARVVRKIIEHPVQLDGVWHLSGEPISKYDLLCLLQRRFDRPDIVVEPCDAVAYDRTLDSTRLRSALGWSPPSWLALADELVEAYERTPCRTSLLV